MNLHALGWNSFFQQHWESHFRRFAPARVVEEQRGAYRIASEIGELDAEITGRFRHAAVDQPEFPAVGDWVAVEFIAEERKALIHEVMPRFTKLSRKTAGERPTEQILVANVDTVLIVTSLNAEFNLRRIERYLGMVWEGGAQPVLVLSKADLCADPGSILDEIATVALEVSAHVVSGLTRDGLEALAPYVGPGNTVVLVGSSGVGKSTIINALLDSDIQITREIRAGDSRGRHATTCRRLFLMPTGGVLIDTPGIRELHLWDAAGLEDTFEEIGRLAAGCRFRDCRHNAEPGCAVQHAIGNGELEAKRLDNFHKLQRELEHLDRRRNPSAQAEQRKRWRQISKAMKRHKKEKP